MIPTKMKAVGLYAYLPVTEKESLLDLVIDTPSAQGRDLLVQVKAISVNPVDVKVRSPKNQKEQSPRILGWDVAGTVVSIGSQCTLFQPGDDVYYAGSIIRPGGNSEFHLIDERIVGKKPQTLTFAQSAALPLTSITAWESLYHRLGISLETQENQGKRILLIGAAGGVGSIAIQLAKKSGLTVIGTASRPQSEAWVKQLGADAVITHHEAFAPQLKKLGIDGVEYILCLNHTEAHWGNIADAIAPQGKICAIVETSRPLDMNLIRKKSVTFVWELMFTRPIYETEDMIEQHRLLNQLADFVDQGLVSTTMTQCLSPINAANLRLAHEKVEQGDMIGKIVLEHFV